MRRKVLLIGGGLGLLLGVFLLGRFTAPTRKTTIVQEERVALESHEEVAQTTQVRQEGWVVREVSDNERVRIVLHDRQRSASGDQRERRLSVETSRATAQGLVARLEQQSRQEESRKQQARVEVREVQRLVQVEREQPRWHLQALFGADRHLRPLYGANLSYRLLGPLSVGAWGASSGVGGVSVGVEF